MQGTASSPITRVQVPARPTINHSMAGMGGRSLRIVPDEILHGADGVIVCLHGILKLLKQIDVSGD